MLSPLLSSLATAVKQQPTFLAQRVGEDLQIFYGKKVPLCFTCVAAQVREGWAQVCFAVPASPSGFSGLKWLFR